MKSNVINVEPKSTKVDEPVLESVEPNRSSSLRDNFYPPEVPQDLVVTSSPICCDVKFELNLDYFDILPKFSG